MERSSRFNASPRNFDEPVTANERIRQPITITDVTLREGQQAAEVAFSADEEVELARMLVDIGVPAIQVGYAGADDASIRRVRRACPRARLVALLVGWKDDATEAMRSAQDAGADVCSILFRSPDAHLADLGYTREQAVERIQTLIRLALDLRWPDVVFTPSFATVADFEFLTSLYRGAVEAGASVISVSDSMGTAKPGAIRFMVESMRRVAGDAGVRVHMHNDFGLAVANTLAGIEAGADWVDASINGLGERAGNCPLEEIVPALEALYGIRLGIRTEGLYGLCKLVERITNVAIPPMKPVVGENCFANKLEIHVKAAAANPSLMEPYDPALVGNRRTIKLGRGSGPTGIRMKLSELGLSLLEDAIEAAVREVNDRAIRTKRAVSDDEFRRLVESLQSRPLALGH